MLGTARLKLIKQLLLCFVVFLKIGGWVEVFATELHHIHEKRYFFLFPISYSFRLFAV